MIVADSFTQVMIDLLHAFMHSGRTYKVSPRGLGSKEFIGVTFQILRPKKRLYLSSNVNIFKMIGRLMWEMRGDQSLKSIEYYDLNAKKFADGEIIPTAYGHRISKHLPGLLNLMRQDPHTRRAAFPIIEETDDFFTTREYPCMLGFQFLIRDDALHMVTFARSQDLTRVLPMDVMFHTTLQEVIAYSLGCNLGTYTHHCGSLHVQDHVNLQKEFKDLSTGIYMSDPSHSVHWALDWASFRQGIDMAEQTYRLSEIPIFTEIYPTKLPTYSSDLGQHLFLLRIYAFLKRPTLKDRKEVVQTLLGHLLPVYRYLADNAIEQMGGLG